MLARASQGLSAYPDENPNAYAPNLKHKPKAIHACQSLCDTGENFIYIYMINLMLKRLDSADVLELVKKTVRRKAK